MMDRGTAAKRFLLAVTTFAALAASTAANAGFLDPAPAYPSKFVNTTPLYDWTGFFVGINGGGSFGRMNWRSDPDETSGIANVSSGLIGGTIGYNAQRGSFIFGEEFDFDWRNFNATIPAASCALASPSGTANCEFKSSWLATARLRFGYAIGNFLPYVTGGVSMGDYNTNIVGQPFGTTTAVTFNWTAGAGVEFVVSGPLTAKLEYLYVNHTNTACTIPCGGGPIGIGASENIFRAGVNYRLWGR
jgi:outer membrane immunogenic protein